VVLKKENRTEKIEYRNSYQLRWLFLIFEAVIASFLAKQSPAFHSKIMSQTHFF